LAHILVAACTIAAWSGNARAESCVETVIRLQAGVAALPSSDPARATLASTLETARASDARKCEQITMGVAQALEQRSDDSRTRNESTYSGFEGSADAPTSAETHRADAAD
jgi:hypothetical protein